MTRPKVPDDKRQRTAQACESCKRRKQKCNGLRPCNTCTKRNLTCDYDSRAEPGIVESASSPPKRARHTSPESSHDIKEPSIKSKKSSIDIASTPVPAPVPFTQPNSAPSIKTEPRRPTFGQSAPHRRVISDHELETISRRSTTSGGDEEAEVYTETRMLQDPTGRLLYLGDSATLSYLQFIRMVVESLDGPSPFTMDPSRHRLMEATVTLPPRVKPSTILPDRQTANVLVESYFVNTSGLIEVFDKSSFLTQMDSCYSDPLSADPTFLCLLNLAFAIGLVLATPVANTQEDHIIRRLNSSDIDRAELFFRSAKSLGDPSTGFEDADFWSVQALVLMAVYMLCRTKRNAAYAYYGMAARSAFALGLHRHETMVIFNMAERALRRNVWRSLYILDRFLAAALGRPAAIAEEDCSLEVLRPPESYGGSDADNPQSGALDAAVRSCQFIGIMLKKIYAKRKISTKLAQEIFDQHKEGPQKEHPSLYWRQAAANNLVSTAHGIAILHVNLLYCHAVILLTRPFFLYLINRSWRERKGVARQSPRIGSRMEKFSEACVKASYQTIALVQMGFESRYLPQRNPFIIHFLFAAALVILSNEFSSLHKYPTYHTHVNQAISILRYCAETDPQATRLIYILTTFQDVVSKVSPQSSEDRLEATARTTTTASLLDPAGTFFLDQPSSRSSTLQSHKTQTSRENSLTSADPAARRSYTSATVSPTTASAVPQSFSSVPSSAVHSQDRDEQVVEAEFDFDTLWQGWNMQGSGGHGTGLGVSMNHQIAPIVPSHAHHHRGSFGGYSVSQPPHSQPSDALSASVPLYSISNFH